MGVYRDQGMQAVFKRSFEKVIRELYFNVCSTETDARRMGREARRRTLKRHGIQICKNKSANDSYDPSKKNILFAIESPAVVQDEGWLDDNLEFYAEISFGDFCDLENYYCPRTLYAGFDSFVELDSMMSSPAKSESISIVYSDKTRLEGHRLRHSVAGKFPGQIDLFGAGANNYVKKKRDTLGPYRFQVVIENGKFPEYVSEKFFDCLKTRTVPIYWGGEEAIEKMGFDTDGIIFFDELADLESIIHQQTSHADYERMKSSIEYNRNRLIEIRNQNRFDIYMDMIRPGFLANPGGCRDNFHLE
jgi:hypothetical protein